MNLGIPQHIYPEVPTGPQANIDDLLSLVMNIGDQNLDEAQMK